MVSDFQKKKFLHVYYAFFDTNKSGSIDKQDFELAIEKISTLRGWKPGDITYDLLSEILMQMWEGLQKEADKDDDGEISIDEWLQMWERFSEDPSSESDWQKLYCKCIFQLEDATNDGAIDCQEFATVYESFGLNKEESITAFEKIAKGKDKITWEDFQQLWREYFISDDPEDAGNFIFGQLHL